MYATGPVFPPPLPRSRAGPDSTDLGLSRSGTVSIWDCLDLGLNRLEEQNVNAFGMVPM